jgi:hypothetical protein
MYGQMDEHCAKDNSARVALIQSISGQLQGTKMSAISEIRHPVFLSNFGENIVHIKRSYSAIGLEMISTS